MPNRIALVARLKDGDTFRRSSEFETLDRILYLNVNVKIFSLVNLSLFLVMVFIASSSCS